MEIKIANRNNFTSEILLHFAAFLSLKLRQNFSNYRKDGDQIWGTIFHFPRVLKILIHLNRCTTFVTMEHRRSLETLYSFEDHPKVVCKNKTSLLMRSFFLSPLPFFLPASSLFLFLHAKNNSSGWRLIVWRCFVLYSFCLETFDISDIFRRKKFLVGAVRCVLIKNTQEFRFVAKNISSRVIAAHGNGGGGEGTPTAR